MILFYIFIFILSFAILIFASNRLIRSLTKVAKFLGWKEFVVAFFTMALASSIPNLSVGISSALHRIPSLAFGEIIGNNIIDLSLAVALAALVSRKGINLPSRTVQGSGLFTIFIAVLPLLLISDRTLSKSDGFILILAFFIYISWLFSKKDRFGKVYDTFKEQLSIRGFLRDVFNMFFSVFLLIIAAEGIVRSATFFSELLNFPIALIGILVVGVGNAMPEVFFSIQAARREEDWMVVGDLMGAVIIPASLVLGIVALIQPIVIKNITPFLIARVFLVVSALFFLIFLRTGKRITKKEALFLLLIYLAFLFAEFAFFNL